MKVPFVKMRGAGNDFVVIDEWEGEVIPAAKKSEFAVVVSDRHFGIGSDGVIFIEKSKNADGKVVFYNPDGSIPEMDGNGIRCFAKYLHDNGYINKTKMLAETGAGMKILNLTLFNDKVEQVRVDMGAPQMLRGEAQISGNPKDTFIDQVIDVDSKEYKATSVGMGNPHVTIFVDDVNAFDVRGIGSKIRQMSEIFPHGVNVNFVQVKAQNQFIIRTYERGVEDETLTCGTGICASAVAAVLTRRGDQSKTMQFKSRGGDLQVKLDTDKGRIIQVHLIGPATEVYKGSVDYEPSARFEAAAYNLIANILQ